MTEQREIKYNWSKEFKAIFLFLFAILGFLFIPRPRLTIYLVIVSLVLLVIGAYIKINNLRIIRPIFYLTLCFYNVLSLVYMVQYFLRKDLDNKIYQNFLYPFINEGKIDIGHIIWIYVLTITLILMQRKTGSSSGVDDDRQ